jgi:hypothetical protein
MCDYTFPKTAPNSTEKVKMPTQYSAGFAYQEVVNVRRASYPPPHLPPHTDALRPTRDACR